jgi:four helix bundle protein
MTGRELAARIDAWVVSVWAFSRPLLVALEWRDSVLQLRRASSGAAANYGAAVFARSHADFTSKVGIALEEIEESWRWLRLLKDTMNDPPRELIPLIDEARQLTAVLAASHQTARRNRESSRRKR